MSFVERSNKFTSNGIVNESLSFIPDITIDCNPPYVKGQRDSCWVKYNPKIWKPNFNSKSDCQKLLGMSIQPLS